MKKLFILLITFTINLKAQWVNIKSENYMSIYLMQVNNSELHFGGKNGLFKLTSNGLTSLNSGLSSESVVSLGFSGNTIYAGLDGGGFFISTDNGSSWKSINTGLPNKYAKALTLSGSDLIVGLYNGGVFISKDNGASWTDISAGLVNKRIMFLKNIDNVIYVCSEGGGLKYSNDNGSTWKNTGLTSGTVQALVKNGNNLFVGLSNGGVKVSSDNAVTWTDASNGVVDNNIRALEVYGGNVFAGNWSGVFLTTNNGVNWSKVDTGLWSKTINALAILGTNIYAGTSSGAIFRRPLADMVTSIEKDDELPINFILYQNYPNPFNPTTTIKYSIPNVIPRRAQGDNVTSSLSRSDQFVKLKVYDIIGREVATLVNEYQPAGNYEVKFDASKLSSGIYFYKLQAGNFVQTRKMILTK